MPNPDPHPLADYQAAHDWLLSLITDPEGRRYFVEKSAAQRLPELEEQLARTRHFLAFAGHPERSYRAIHVAGTSGKGSVSAMLASMLTAAGIASGLHTSPYLQQPTEKLVVTNAPISHAQFAREVAQLRTLHERWAAHAPWPALRYGEAWVALTYLYFAHAGVDWAVIETGLGGRYDPTNAIDGDLAVITNIDYDHTNILGDTLQSIAAHKAGIIKPGALAVTAEQADAPLAIIAAEAQQHGVPLYRLGEEFAYTLQDNTLSVEAPYNRYDGIHLPLKGTFQPLNAALAVAGLDVLREHRGLAIDVEAVRAGLAAVRFPGRMELVQQQPLVILDGAHNPAKMRGLAASLQAAYPGRKATVLIGMLATKDVAGSLVALAPLAERWVLTEPQVFGKPALPAAALAGELAALGNAAPVHIEPDPLTALAHTLDNAAADDLLVLTGSIYLIGALRGHWFPIDAPEVAA